MKLKPGMICFKNLFDEDLHFVHAAKCASRTTLGWMVLMREPNLINSHPEWFNPVPDKRDHAYSEIRRKTRKINLPEDAKIIFCTKRDPVKRFISCFQNMHWLGHIGDVQTLIENWDQLMKDNPVLYTHFRTQTEFYESNKSRFTHIFDHSKMKEVKEFLEDYSGTNLPDLHLQQSGTKVDIELTNEQLDFVHRWYAKDYENGWC